VKHSGIDAYTVVTVISQLNGERPLLATCPFSRYTLAVSWKNSHKTSVSFQKQSTTTTNVLRLDLRVTAVESTCFTARPESRRRWVDLAAPSQVVSVPSRHRNFPLKSPTNFRIKVTTYSQTTVWTCYRQHASRSYSRLPLLSARPTVTFTASEHHYPWPVTIYTAWWTEARV